MPILARTGLLTRTFALIASALAEGAQRRALQTASRPNPEPAGRGFAQLSAARNTFGESADSFDDDGAVD